MSTTTAAGKPRSLTVKKGDTVQVITGKDRGFKGRVLVAYPKEDKLLVEGVNRIKKHTKVTTTTRGAQSGGIVTQEAPIARSNVMVVCPHCNKPTRVGHRRDTREKRRADGTTYEVTTSVRTCRRCGGDL